MICVSDVISHEITTLKDESENGQFCFHLTVRLQDFLVKFPRNLYWYPLYLISSTYLRRLQQVNIMEHEGVQAHYPHNNTSSIEALRIIR